MLAHLKQWNTEYPGVTTSVELEKAREELKLLLPLADVVFIGKDFAKFQGCKDRFDALQKNIGLVKMGLVCLPKQAVLFNSILIF